MTQASVHEKIITQRCNVEQQVQDWFGKVKL